MTEIYVQLRESGFPRELPSGLAELAQRAQAGVEPMDPGAADPRLTSWLRIIVAPTNDPDDLIRELLTLPEVAAAYVKPPDALP